ETGEDLGPVEAVELVTVGQRRGMGHATDGKRRFVTAVDIANRRVSIGSPEAAHASDVRLHTVSWVDGAPAGLGGPGGLGGPHHGAGGADVGDEAGVPVLAQCSAHGHPVPSSVQLVGDKLSIVFGAPQRRVAPGQTVALYDPDHPDTVVGSGIAG
ncbi:MAG TPA: aminomethyltransferase beta-barrel domain-containing protein, partial [Acidimicrobiales bacterium]|nr:aminomethyltransferase beta-barrel domain-containing protein [Acidimicrobiales bacterium]